MENNLLFNSLKYLFDEYKANFRIIFKLAKEVMYQQTLRTSLGIGWVVFRDVIYFTVFILFRVLIAGSGNIEGMNFILFLMIGTIIWNFMNECINGAVMAVKNNKFIFSSISFPVVIMPTIEVIAIIWKRLFTLLILLFTIFKFGNIADITWWMFIYYFLCMVIFMIVWNLIFSSLVAVSNDFEQFYRAITSVLFYTMPIIWSFEVIKPYPTITRIFKLNPFVYIIEGFRDACVRGDLPDLEYTIYFWGLSLFLLCIGAILQYKLRRHYVDLI